jgi:hypothetical protein
MTNTSNGPKGVKGQQTHVQEPVKALSRLFGMPKKIVNNRLLKAEYLLLMQVRQLIGLRIPFLAS